MEISKLHIPAFGAPPNMPVRMGETTINFAHCIKTCDPFLLNRDLLGEFE
jgi:hypothetical protein